MVLDDGVVAVVLPLFELVVDVEIERLFDVRHQIVFIHHRFPVLVGSCHGVGNRIGSRRSVVKQGTHSQ